MFFKSQPASSQNGTAAALSIISSDVVITGDLQSDGDIHIDGRVEGNVRAASLVVGEKSQIRGEIEAHSLAVHGCVEGSIRARKILLAKGSHVEGHITHTSLEVEPGAFVQGRFRQDADLPALPAIPQPENEREPIVERRRPGSPMRVIDQTAAGEDGLRKTG